MSLFKHLALASLLVGATQASAATQKTADIGDAIGALIGLGAQQVFGAFGTIGRGLEDVLTIAGGHDVNPAVCKLQADQNDRQWCLVNNVWFLYGGVDTAGKAIFYYKATNGYWYRAG